MSKYFTDNITPDYFWGSPVRTKKPCKNPEFADHRLHRVAIMRDEFWGDGSPGWTVKRVCNGCGREFKADGFYPGKREEPTND